MKKGREIRRKEGRKEEKKVSEEGRRVIYEEIYEGWDRETSNKKESHNCTQ